MKTTFVMLALAMNFWMDYKQAQAIPITIEIEGNVTSVSGSGLPSEIYEGVPFTGTYTYESSTPNSSSYGGVGQYLHNAPYGVDIIIGAVEFKTALNHVNQFEVRIVNSISNWDYYKIISTQNAPFGENTVSNISWSLGGPGDTISSYALPTFAPVINDWVTNVLEISGLDSYDHDFLIQGVVTHAVPEPLTSTLLLTACAIFINRKR